MVNESKTEKSLNINKLNKKVLNAGCGEDFYGTDRIDCVKTKAVTQVCDLNNKLPFENNYFDEVYCKSVLQHIGNVKLFVSELLRVLKKGGKIWLSADNADYIPFLFRNVNDYIKYDYETNFQLYLFKKEHLRHLFSSFQGIEINYIISSWKLFFLPKKYKCSNIVITGKK